MKLLTYLADQNKQPSFGFKLNDSIIDIRKSAAWINKDQGNEKFLSMISGNNTILEKEPLEKASRIGQLFAFKHKGFWKCVDTKRDKIILDTRTLEYVKKIK